MEDVSADLVDRSVVPVAGALGVAGEHGHRVAAPQERVDQVGADEPGAAGDENSQLPSLFGAEGYPKRSLAIVSPRESLSRAALLASPSLARSRTGWASRIAAMPDWRVPRRSPGPRVSRSFSAITKPSLVFSRTSRRCRADRKSTRLNSSHVAISYAVFCLK